jgi:hypothetical protein
MPTTHHFREEVYIQQRQAEHTELCSMMQRAHPLLQCRHAMESVPHPSEVVVGVGVVMPTVAEAREGEGGSGALE